MSSAYIATRRNLRHPTPESLQNLRIILWNLNEPNATRDPCATEYTDPTTGIEWQLVNMEPTVLEIAGCSHTKREAVNWAQIDYMIVEGLPFWVLDSLVDEGWETVKPEHLRWTGNEKLGGEGIVWDIFSVVLEHRKTVWVPPNT